MDMPKKQLVAEALIDLHRRLSTLATRSHERRKIMQETANLYGVSEQSLYRALAQRARPRALRRSDRGTTRVLPQDKMEYYCEVIAARKVRTSNKKGRHLSTGEAIRLIEEFGIETPEGLIKAQKSMFKITTVNRYLRQWGYDHETLRRQPAAFRFQAEYSNDCWQFDLSPSDLKEIKEPLWLQPSKGAPTLMLFSVVDDRSGVAYQEYRCVYGEDVEAGLRFLFNAMAPKQIDGFLFQGIPKMIYLDHGPIARSHVFQQVMLEIRMIPRKGTFSSCVISIAPATASAQRNSARIAVALRGANRPKLKKRRLSQNTTNASTATAIPIAFCSSKSHRAPVIAVTSCSACDSGHRWLGLLPSKATSLSCSSGATTRQRDL